MKFIYSAVLSIVLLISYSFVENRPEKGIEIEVNPEFTNLKILPKDISKEDLERVMHGFNDALGVKCSFCHAPGANDKLDFASDAIKYKEISRGMMKMTSGINKKYFHVKNPAEFKVTCFTCHNGKEEPQTHAALKE